MSEQPQPTMSGVDSEVQTEPTEPTLYQKSEKILQDVIAGTERIAKDATQYVAGITEGETPPEGKVITENDLRMRKAGKELAGEVNKAAIQSATYIADCADAVSKSLKSKSSEPVDSEEKPDEGLSFQKIIDVTIKSLAQTADALSISMREAEKKLSKCKNPNCTCATCECKEGTCKCGAETKLSACKNPNCACTTCECKEGTCKCGAETKLSACKNPNCTCATCECKEGTCKCGAETKLSACKNPNCTYATCECKEGFCHCGNAKKDGAETEA